MSSVMSCFTHDVFMPSLLVLQVLQQYCKTLQNLLLPCPVHAPGNWRNQWLWYVFLQGDPSAVPYAVETVQELLGQKPMFGICMGHQLLGQAFGGKTFKLKFGHHGGNHPVRHNASGANTCD